MPNMTLPNLKPHEIVSTLKKLKEVATALDSSSNEYLSGIRSAIRTQTDALVNDSSERIKNGDLRLKELLMCLETLPL